MSGLNMKRIACVHTVYSVIESFTGQLRDALGDSVLIHTLYDDFLATDPAETGKFSGINHQRLRLDLQAQALTGADILVVSCSTLSPSVRLLRGEFNVPVVAIDDAMVNEAVTLGTRVGLIATANSTVVPSSSALRAAAAAIDKPIDLRVACDEEAIRALKAGDRERHDALVLKMADSMGDRDVLVLAQASMAHMELPVAKHTGVKTLSSPVRCIAQIRKILEEMR